MADFRQINQKESSHLGKVNLNFICDDSVQVLVKLKIYRPKSFFKNFNIMIKETLFSKYQISGILIEVTTTLLNKINLVLINFL